MAQPVPSRPEYSVLLCTTKEDKQKCIDIRLKVFVEEQKFSVEDEIDE